MDAKADLILFMQKRLGSSTPSYLHEPPNWLHIFMHVSLRHGRQLILWGTPTLEKLALMIGIADLDINLDPQKRTPDLAFQQGSAFHFACAQQTQPSRAAPHSHSAKGFSSIVIRDLSREHFCVQPYSKED